MIPLASPKAATKNQQLTPKVFAIFKCSNRNIQAICTNRKPEARSRKPEAGSLRPNPLGEPAAIFLEQKTSHAKTFSEDAMRFLIARGA